MTRAQGVGPSSRRWVSLSSCEGRDSPGRGERERRERLGSLPGANEREKLGSLPGANESEARVSAGSQ